MNITWKPGPLPDEPVEVGHGLCLWTESAGRRRLVAHVEGFDWYHGDANAVVTYAPDRLPADPATAATLRLQLGRLLLERRLEGTLVPGYHVTPNA